MYEKPENVKKTISTPVHRYSLKPSERLKSDISESDTKRETDKKTSTFEPVPEIAEVLPKASYSESIGLCVPRLTSGLPSQRDHPFALGSGGIPQNDPRSQLSFLASEGSFSQSALSDLGYSPSFGPDDEEQDIENDLNAFFNKPKMPSLPPIALPVISDTRQLRDPRFERMFQDARLESKPPDPRLERLSDPRQNLSNDPRLNRSQDPRLNRPNVSTALDPKMQYEAPESHLAVKDPRRSRQTKSSSSYDASRGKKKLSLHDYKKKVKEIQEKPEFSFDPASNSEKAVHEDDFLEDIDMRHITGPPTSFFEKPLAPHHASIIMNPNVDAVKNPLSQNTDVDEAKTSQENNSSSEIFNAEDIVDDPDDMAKELNQLSDPDDGSQSPKHMAEPPINDPMLSEAMKKLVEHSENVNLFTEALKRLQDSAEIYGEKLHDPEFLVKKIAEEIEVLNAAEKEKEKRAEEARLKAEQERLKAELEKQIKAEEERQKAEEERRRKAEQERQKAEEERRRKVEQERLKAELERQKTEQLEQERLAAERLEKERLLRIERERIQAEIERKRIEAEMAYRQEESIATEDEENGIAEIKSPDTIMSPDHSNDSKYDSDLTVKCIPLESSEDMLESRLSGGSALEEAMKRTLEELNKVEKKEPKQSKSHSSSRGKRKDGKVSNQDLSDIPIPSGEPSQQSKSTRRSQNTLNKDPGKKDSLDVKEGSTFSPSHKVRGMKDKIEPVPMDLDSDPEEEDIDLRSGFPVHHNLLQDCKSQASKPKPQIKINLKINAEKSKVTSKDEDFRSKTTSKDRDTVSSEASKKPIDMFAEDKSDKHELEDKDERKTFHSQNFKAVSKSEENTKFSDPFGLGITEDIDIRKQPIAHLNFGDVDLRTSAENSQQESCKDFDLRNSHSRSVSPVGASVNKTDSDKLEQNAIETDRLNMENSNAVSQDSSSSENSNMLFDAYSLGKKTNENKKSKIDFGDVDWRVHVSPKHGMNDFDMRSEQAADQTKYNSEPFSQLNKSIQSMFGSNMSQTISSGYSLPSVGITAPSTQFLPTPSTSQGDMSSLMKNLDFSNLKNILANVQNTQGPCYSPKEQEWPSPLSGK